MTTTQATAKTPTTIAAQVAHVTAGRTLRTTAGGVTVELYRVYGRPGRFKMRVGHDDRIRYVDGADAAVRLYRTAVRQLRAAR